MNTRRIDVILKSLQAPDMLNAAAHVLETSPETYNAWCKLTENQRKNIIAALSAFGENRGDARDRPSIVTNMRRIRLEKRTSTRDACKQVSKTGGISGFSEGILLRLEEYPAGRNKLSADLAAALEQFFGRGWEYLSEKSL
jgi:hypothetical protein